MTKKEFNNANAWDKFEELKYRMGDSYLVDAIAKWIGDDELNEMTKGIARVYGAFEYDEDEAEEDEEDC